MISDPGENPEADPGASAPPRRPWTAGRIATDAAIIAVAVPFVIQVLSPSTGGVCGTTFENSAQALGLIYLGVRLAWIPLKALNDASDRWLTARELRDNLSHDTHGRPSKP